MKHNKVLKQSCFRATPWICVLLQLLFSSIYQVHVKAFSTTPPIPPSNNRVDPQKEDNGIVTDAPNNQDPSVISRRDVFDWPFLAVGSAVITGELLSTALGSLSLSRPAGHEQRVADTIRRSLVEAATTTTSPGLRVLEVGIGADCRLIRRGLYNQAIANLAKSSTNTKELFITGIDLQIPQDDKVKDAKLLLDNLGQSTGVKARLQVQEGSITSKLPFEDGTFDAVICCLTLCSVSDPKQAVSEIQRLIRPSGGTFGYVEHVAVNPNEPYRFLERQQTLLDPLQQLVADNCHLHRYTQTTIHDVFGEDSATTLQEDRFLVDKMWPVSSQSCGVIQRKA